MTELDPFAVLTEERRDYSGDQLSVAQQQLARDIVAVTPLRRGGRRRLAIGLTALALGVPGVAAAAELAGVHTGLFGNPEASTEDVDTSEWLNTCSPEFAEVVREREPSDPLPAGASWSVSARRQVQGTQNGDCGQMQLTGVDAAYAFYAKCAWTSEARAAARAGEDARRERAGRELQRLADSKLNHTIDGGGLVALDRRVARAVREGRMDEPAIDDYYGSNCKGLR